MPDLFSHFWPLSGSVGFAGQGVSACSFLPVSGSALGSSGFCLFAALVVRAAAVRSAFRFNGWHIGFCSAFYALGNLFVRGVNSVWVRGASFFRSNLAVKWDWPRVGLVQASFLTFTFRAPAAFRGRPAPYFRR
jgi:hypothetical protein